MFISSKLPEKPLVQDAQPLHSARATYTQQADTAPNSSLSSGSAESKDCFTTLIDTIKGWISFVWEWLTSWCKGQESSSASVNNNGGSGQPVQNPAQTTVQGAEPAPTKRTWQEVERRLNEEVLQMVNKLVECYSNELSSSEEYFVCVDFNSHATNSEGTNIGKRTGYRIVRFVKEKIIQDNEGPLFALTDPEKGADRLLGGMTVILGKKNQAFSDKKSIILYQVARRWDSAINWFLGPANPEPLRSEYSLERDIESFEGGIKELFQKIWEKAPSSNAGPASLPTSREALPITPPTRTPEQATVTPAASPTSLTPLAPTTLTPQQKINQAIESTILECAAFYEKEKPQAAGKTHRVIFEFKGKYLSGVDLSQCKEVSVQNGKILKRDEDRLFEFPDVYGDGDDADTFRFSTQALILERAEKDQAESYITATRLVYSLAQRSVRTSEGHRPVHGQGKLQDCIKIFYNEAEARTFLANYFK